MRFPLTFLIVLLALPALAQPTFRSLPNAGTYNPATQTVVTVPASGNDVRTVISSLPPSGAAGGDLSGTYPNPTVVNISNVPSSTIANSVFINAVCTAAPTVCGSFFGYSNPLWYGAAGNGTGNDEPAISSASSAACTGGWKRVKFTQGKYNNIQQFNSTCNGLTWFADPQNLMYDAGNPNSAVEIYVNSGFYTTANHCYFNQNGYTDNVITNINFGGDGGQEGITDICNSFNYTGSGQIPRIYLFNVAFSGTGTAWGCGLNTSGVTGFATPYTGTGNTCGNYMGVRAYNVTVEQSALAFNGNATDTFWRGGEIAGNACGGVVGTNSGSGNIIIDINRAEENGYSGFSGVCGAGGPAFEVTGANWNINTQWQGNNGVDVYFDDSCGADTITGGYGGDGQNGAQGSESIIAFNTSCAGTISLSNFAGESGDFGLTAPKYFVENISGTNTFAINGGNVDSGQYSSALSNVVAGALFISPMNSLGQQYSINNTSQNVGTWTSTNTGGTCLNLANSSSGGHQYALCSTGSASDGGAANFTLGDVTGSSGTFTTAFNRFEIGSGGIIGFSSSGDPNASADTGICRGASGLLDACISNSGGGTAYFNSAGLQFGGNNAPIPPGGRLTLSSTAPVLTADVTAATTIYYLPYNTELLPIYNGTEFQEMDITSSGISQGIASTDQPTSQVYDVYAVNVSGTPTLCSMYWGSNTSRSSTAGGKSGSADARVVQLNGIWVNKTAIATSNCYGGAGGTTAVAISQNQGTLLGTYYTSAGGQTQVVCKPTAASGGAALGIFLSNIYNRVPISCTNIDTATAQSSASSSWAVLGSGDTAQWVDGLQQIPFAYEAHVVAGNTAAGDAGSFGVACTGTGTTAPNTIATTQAPTSTIGDNYQTLAVHEGFYPALGLSNKCFAEKQSATGTTDYMPTSTQEDLTVTLQY
jgi:hypothetical protein